MKILNNNMVLNNTLLKILYVQKNSVSPTKNCQFGRKYVEVNENYIFSFRFEKINF